MSTPLRTPRVTTLAYYQEPNKRPPFINLKNIEFITGLLCYFLSLLELFTPNFQGKLTRFCVYFSFTLCDSLFLFFPLLYTDLKPFLECRPPVYFDPPFIKFWKFFQPPLLLGPPVYLALESMSCKLVAKRSSQFH